MAALEPFASQLGSVAQKHGIIPVTNSMLLE